MGFVLRVIHPAEDPAVTDFHTQALLHVVSTAPSLPIPRVIPSVRDAAGHAVWNTSGAPTRRVRCVTYLEGKPLNQTRTTITQLHNLGDLLARLDVALTDLRHPAEDRELLWDAKRG
jgi:Ser/Thr protein kinase RdoA (MazF antagonist)